MYKNENEGPVSPMKKLKILSEQHQNVQKPKELNLEPIKEGPKSDEVRAAEANVEPLLEENPGQYVIFPINHQDMWHMYKHFVDNFWSVTETIEELDKLNLDYDEKQFMKYFSSIYASPQSQALVINTFAEDLCKLIQVTEAKFFYGHQLFMQNIHYEMYNKLLDKFTPQNDEKEKLFKIVENFDAVANKRNWISKWESAPFGDKILASACIHAHFFIVLDLLLEWLKNKTRASFSHEVMEIFEKMIADQELERDFACLMLSHLKSKPSKERIIEVINQSAKIEFDFLINGVKIDLLKIELDEILQLIDKKTKDLKTKIFGCFDEKKKVMSSVENKKSEASTEEYTTQTHKENHQKLVFDEDF